jgi:hypothetical protein
LDYTFNKSTSLYYRRLYQKSYFARIEDTSLGEKRFEKENCCLAVIGASFGKYHDGGF